MVSLHDIKNWSPEVEKVITADWQASELFPVVSSSVKPVYSIDTPPPYVNTPIHIAQAVTYCYMDFFARYKRMKGYDVVFPLGLDRNGLPIELAAEKKFNVSPFMVGREKFIEYCEQLISEGSSSTMESFSQLGISFTSYREGEHIGSVYKTDSPEYRALTQSSFIDLFKKGLVYEDSRVNNWDPKLQTTIADSEIEYKDLQSSFNEVVWTVKETGEQVVIATTRPELMGSCSAVIFNPKDSRYQHLAGKTAVIPMYGFEVPIMAHHFAKPDKGTGLVMMCAGGDLTDLQFVREQKFKPIILVNPDGKLNEKAGFLQGLKVRAAREKMIEELRARGLLKGQVMITHSTPMSERSGAEIEFIEMPEFYMKQKVFVDDIRNVSSQMTFYPEESKKILDSWLDAIAIDWPISRRRFYATPIPLWHAGELTALPPSGPYYVPWKSSPPKDAPVYVKGEPTGKLVADYPDVSWVGETRVFDTWMDSSLSQLFILKFGVDEAFFKKAFPASLRPQGKEIVRTWLYYSLLRGFLATGKPCFDSVWIHQHLTDAKGRKMSKSLGNGIDPKVLVEKFGAEAIRLWASTEGNLASQDLKVSEERIKGEVKTLNKLLNIAKFILLFEKPKKPKVLLPLDTFMLRYIDGLSVFADEHFDEYDFYAPMSKLRDFLWNMFASQYVELVKSRAYNESGLWSKEDSDSAKYALYEVFSRLLLLLYPVMPQITSVIGSSFSLDVLSASWPVASSSSLELDEGIAQKIGEFNALVWKAKKDANLSLKQPITGIVVPQELSSFEADLKACHNLQ